MMQLLSAAKYRQDCCKPFEPFFRQQSHTAGGSVACRTCLAVAVVPISCRSLTLMNSPISHLQFLAAGEKIGGQTASFVAIYIATAVLSELVSNNAAAALMCVVFASSPF